ncbi:unnamed protein product [Prorocentrum cordatum]|uniref:BTB domain-containing protein n=1 Tax=Prorocentrum cordatum TaxID=2364126 RepID=A0ABN9PID8_9DINO|nr:unnamed protein product [Polarella glacialis]
MAVIDLLEDEAPQNRCEEGRCEDVTFVVEGAEVRASRLRLSSKSSYFRALLGAPFLEGGLSDKIVIRDVTKEAFELCLLFLASGSISAVTEGNAAAVWRAADMYDMPALSSACRRTLINSVNDATLFATLSAADALGPLGSEVSEHCLSYLRSRASTILRADPGDSIRDLSAASVFAVCAALGQHVALSRQPGSLMSQWLGPLLDWGAARWGTYTFESLYTKANALDFAELSGFAPAASLSWCAEVAAAALSRNTALYSPSASVGGFSFGLRLDTMPQASSESIGLYVCPKTRADVPEWWQFHAAFKVTARPSDLDPSGACTWTCNALFGHHDSSLAWGVGRHGLLPHARAFPAGSGKLHVRGQLALNSLLSFLNAHTFLHASTLLANRCPFMATGHVEDLLSLDSLPVASEDTVLSELLAARGTSGDAAAARRADRLLRWGPPAVPVARRAARRLRRARPVEPRAEGHAAVAARRGPALAGGPPARGVRHRFGLPPLHQGKAR